MKTKDYWVTCFKIFTTMSVLTAFGVLLVLFILGANSKLPTNMAVLLVVFGVVFTALWSVIARMFKRKSPKAIMAGYLLLSAFLALRIVVDVLHPEQISVSDLLIFILYGWFISCVYKAQKQGVSQAI